MIDRLKKAMEIEQLYQQHRLNGEEPFHLIDKIVELGYESLDQYFTEKKGYKFQQWKPEVYYIDIGEFSDVVEDAIVNAKYGVYIPVADGLYAYHGTDTIDYDLCNRLGVRVVELNYRDGTIVGSSSDFSIEIVAPFDIGLESSTILNKICKIVSKYADNVSVSGNDLLINGEKVMGSMTRHVGRSFVWAAQISFGEYSDTIEQVCNKKSGKKPSRIKAVGLSKDKLEKEVLSWLRKR